MDKIMSTRVDESIVYLIDSLSQKLHTSKKNIVETAVRSYSEKINDQKKHNVFNDTCGIWERDEDASATIKKSREAFNSSFTRHHS